VTENYRGLAYLLAANFQALGLILGGWGVGSLLDKRFPVEGLSWITVSILIAVVVVIYTWYVMFQSLVRQKSDEAAKKIPD